MHHVQILFALAISTACVSSAYATPIEIGQDYHLEGGVNLFLPDGGIGARMLLEHSTFRFDETGLFFLNLVTEAGTAQIRLNYDIADFRDGGNVTLSRFSAQRAQDIRQRSAARAYDPFLDTNMNGTISSIDALLHIKDVGDSQRDTLVNIGVFTPNNSEQFSFIASNMDGVFRLERSTPTFSIWNSQHLVGPVLLGGTDFHLTAGEPVPEPATAILLASGMLGGCVRRKKAAAR